MLMLLILAASMLTAPMGDTAPVGETDDFQVKFEGRVIWNDVAGTYAVVSVFDKYNEHTNGSPVEVYDNGGFYSIYIGATRVARAGTPFKVECYLCNPGSGTVTIAQVVSGIVWDNDFTWVWNQPPPGGYYQHAESFIFD